MVQVGHPFIGFLVPWAVSAVAFLLMAKIVSGFRVTGNGAALWAAALIGIL